MNSFSLPHSLPLPPSLPPSLPHFPSQHYQNDADGLCCRLKHSVKKEGLIEFDVSAEDFKASGWHIPRAELAKKSLIGKGEYGGEFCWEEKMNVQSRSFKRD